MDYESNFDSRVISFANNYAYELAKTLDLKNELSGAILDNEENLDIIKHFMLLFLETSVTHVAPLMKDF